MSLLTTVVGSMPKPNYLGVPAYVKNGEAVTNFHERCLEYYASLEKEETHQSIARAKEAAIRLQEDIGIDVITDGEIDREDYIIGFCRRFEGFNVKRFKKQSMRNGAYEGHLPVIDGQIRMRENHISMAQQWMEAQQIAKHPVKCTLPGPLSTWDSLSNAYYKSEHEFYDDFIKILNQEIKSLAAAGCQYVQIDEPVMVRKPKAAIAFAIDNLSRCFEGVPPSVMKIVHCCCGYPCYLDQTDYIKADQDSYHLIADKLDNAGLDAISLEDAHRRNDITLFSKFKNTKVILGVVKIASSRVKSAEEIRSHITDVMQYIPPERLIIAPDCGLHYLTNELVAAKLGNMVAAVKSLRSK